MRKSGKRMPGEFRVPILTKGRLEQLAAVPICAWVGYNGMGKSAGAAAVSMMHADAGRRVLGTARLIDHHNRRPCELPAADRGLAVLGASGRTCASPSHGEPDHLHPHPMWEPLLDYRQLFTFRDGHIWADEATGMADARSHQSMPGEVSDYLPRLRAQQVTLHWTTIHWSFADVRLRRVTWSAVWAVGLWPRYVGDEIWGRNRIFYYRAYDAKNLADDFDPANRDDEARAMMRAWAYGPRWPAFGYYATLDAVHSLGGTDESGMCLLCGGHRGRKRCTGHDQDGTASPARSRRDAPDRPDGPQRSEDRPDGPPHPLHRPDRPRRPARARGRGEPELPHHDTPPGTSPRGVGPSGEVVPGAGALPPVAHPLPEQGQLLRPAPPLVSHLGSSHSADRPAWGPSSPPPIPGAAGPG